MFDLEPLSADQLRADERLFREFHRLRVAEAVRYFVSLREKFCNAYATIDLVVLEAVCPDCRARFSLSEFPRLPEETVVLWPDQVEDTIRVYLPESRSVIFWVEDDRQQWSVKCTFCAEWFTNTCEYNVFRVVENPLADYFGMSAEGRNRFASKATRKEIIALYGKSCFQCKRHLRSRDVTIDHITAYGGNGQTVETNLQVLCAQCNQKKGDSPVQVLKIALDFPLRTPPSETWEGAFW